MPMFVALVGALALAFASLTAAAEEPKPFVTDDLQQFIAKVDSVDHKARTVVLTGPDGQQSLIAVGPEVRNLDQVKPGDSVVVSYYVGVAAAVRPPSDGDDADSQDAEVLVQQRAKPGERPGGGVGRSVVATVRIESVNAKDHIVTFKRRDGIERTLAVKNPDAQRFIKQLKPGDQVDVVYTEATAVSVEPAAPEDMPKDTPKE